MPAQLIRREYERPDRDVRAALRGLQRSGAAMGRRLHQVI